MCKDNRFLKWNKKRCLRFFCPRYFLLLRSLHDLKQYFMLNWKVVRMQFVKIWMIYEKSWQHKKYFLTEKRQLVRHKKRFECITCGHPDMHAVIDFQVTEWLRTNLIYLFIMQFNKHDMAWKLQKKSFWFSFSSAI